MAEFILRDKTADLFKRVLIRREKQRDEVIGIHVGFYSYVYNHAYLHIGMLNPRRSDTRIVCACVYMYAYVYYASVCVLCAVCICRVYV